MSADRLADAIEGSNAIGQTLPDRAADRVREAFFVIDRDDLPEVEPERPGYSGYVYIDGNTYSLKTYPEQYDVAIRELIALREYRREHPWVDEEVVKHLAEDISLATADDWSPDTLARDLIADGWTKPEVAR